MGTGASELTSECGWKQGDVAIATIEPIRMETESPFPVSPKGKAGAGGFPPRRQHRAAPPARGPAPLRDPPAGRMNRFLLTSTGLLMEAMSEAIGAAVRSAKIRPRHSPKTRHGSQK